MDAMTFVWMFVVLKVPIVAALVLIWWAVRAPEEAEGTDEGGGGSDRERPPGPRHPRPPRRGPHAGPAPAPPRRVRARAGLRSTRTSR